MTSKTTVIWGACTVIAAGVGMAYLFNQQSREKYEELVQRSLAVQAEITEQNLEALREKYESGDISLRVFFDEYSSLEATLYWDERDIRREVFQHVAFLDIGTEDTFTDLVELANAHNIALVLDDGWDIIELNDGKPVIYWDGKQALLYIDRNPSSFLNAGLSDDSTLWFVSSFVAGLRKAEDMGVELNEGYYIRGQNGELECLEQASPDGELDLKKSRAVLAALDL